MRIYKEQESNLILPEHDDDDDDDDVLHFIPRIYIVVCFWTSYTPALDRPDMRGCGLQCIVHKLSTVCCTQNYIVMEPT